MGGAIENITSSFGVERVGDITWAHRANNRGILKKYARSPEVMMVEGDVLYSPVLSRSSGLETGGAVMAHDYDQKIDLTFEEWLKIILEVGKGAKVDFKRVKSGVREAATAAAEFCLGVLERVWDPRVPLVLNADVYLGPNGEDSSFAPLDPREFVRQCDEYRRHCNPNVLLSLGWVTAYSKSGEYTDEMITAMLAAVVGPATFPIRACFIRDSWGQIQRLLDDPQHTLTIWNNESVSDELCEWLREETDPGRTFYDIVDPTNLSPIRLWEN